MTTYTFRLPSGRFVTTTDDYWVLYDAPGRVLYAGDAEGLVKYAEDHNVVMSEGAGS